mgnify:CR=1 FL=1
MYHGKLNSTNDQFKESSVPCIAEPLMCRPHPLWHLTKYWLTKKKESYDLHTSSYLIESGQRR